jgi:parallel beta-helix repeat protein
MSGVNKTFSFMRTFGPVTAAINREHADPVATELPVSEREGHNEKPLKHPVRLQYSMKQCTLAKAVLAVCIACLQPAMVTSSLSGTPYAAADAGGATLYVGGSGPDNYSRIQHAIDDADDGDTVYIYNGTYAETIWIGKSICLIGEHKNGTIIDGGGRGTVVTIESSGVTVRACTVTGGGGNFTDAGIRIVSDNVVVRDSIVRNNNGSGIYLTSASRCTVAHNTMVGNRYSAIYVTEESHSNNISHNTVRSSISGIHAERSNQQMIEHNEVRDCATGIYLSENRENMILDNHFVDNEEGMFCYYAVGNTIQFNNFVSNVRNARFMKFFHIGFLGPNTWRHNYWDDWPGVGVKVIFGGMYVRTFSLIGIFLPWVEIDWRPASELN